MLFAEQQVVAKFRESFSTLTIIPKVFSAASFLKFFFLPLLSPFSLLLLSSHNVKTCRTIENLSLEYDKSSYLVIGCSKTMDSKMAEFGERSHNNIQYLFRFYTIQPTFVSNKIILCALSLQILQYSIQKMAGIHIDVFSLSSNKLCKQEQ